MCNQVVSWRLISIIDEMKDFLQGRPISIYFFFLVAESISHVLKGTILKADTLAKEGMGE